MARLILHVDDDPQLPDGVVALLTADGYEWVQTADPEQAMRCLAEREVALVLIEVDLQGCDGLDLLAGMLAAHGDLRVLVLTRHERDSGIHGEVIALGVHDFLTKPVLRGQLVSSIREVALPPSDRPTAAQPDAEAATLSGDIDDSPVPELLARLRRRGAAGVIRLQREGRVVGVQLRNGTPICVASSRWDGPVSEDEAESELFATFGWPDGGYQFFTGRKLPADGAGELSGDPVGLLLCGVLQSMPRELARERLHKRSTLYVQTAEACRELVDDVDLTPRQSAVLSDLGGQTSLGDLLASMEFEERMLYGLWVAGLIDLHAVPTLDLTDLHGEEVRELREPEVVKAPSWAPTPGGDRSPPPPSRRESRPQPRPKPSDVDGDERALLVEQLRELAQQVMAGDDFEALGVSVDASDAALGEAYRQRLAEIPVEALEGRDFDLRARAERIRDRIESAWKHLKDPESRRAYTLLRKEERQDREAENAAERALEGERWFRKGQAYLEGRRYGEAAEAFGMAAHLDPREGEYVAHLGYALFLSRPDDKVVQREAMEHVANGIKRSPTREMSYVYLGRILKARGDEQGALKIFRRALRVKRDSHPALQEIRLLEMRQRKQKGGILSRILGS